MKKLILSSTGLYLNTVSYIAPKIAGKHGFNIFCYPAGKMLKQHHIDFLSSAEQFRFKDNNADIQVYKWGNGSKKVLFLHGWKSHTFRWKNYIKSLPLDEYTVYSFDAPGHGLSGGRILHVPLYSSVILNFINSIGTFDSVVSHSMGGFSILYALFTQPSLPVKKLVLMGAPGEAADFVKVFQDTLNLKERAVSVTLQYFKEKIGMPLEYFSTEKFAANLTIPGLIIHDIGDKDAPYSHAVRVKEVWRNSVLLTTEGLNHNLKSDKVVEAVKDFIVNDSVKSKNYLFKDSILQ